MCGISAFSGKKNLNESQKKIVRYKMMILGLYNQTRGEHGCGLFMNQAIKKGYEDKQEKVDNKLIMNFLAQEDWIMPELDTKKGTSIIMHTRQATMGAHVESNTHPFYVKSENDNPDIVLVHNGTLKNSWALCKEYNVDDTKIYVDSHAIATIIQKSGLEILDKYKGAAALIWTDPNNADHLYVYHGASKETKNGQVITERPMWFLCTDEGVYFSSMWSSLNAIRESEKDEVFELKTNIVFQVRNGKFTDFEHKVNREEMNIEYNYANGYYSNQSNVYNNNSSFNSKETLKSLVWDETKPIRGEKKDRAYFHKNRYYINDLKCNGIYNLTAKGERFIEESAHTQKYYFFEGVLLKDANSYKELNEIADKQGTWPKDCASNFGYNISKYANQVVTCHYGEAMGIDDQWRFCYYQNGSRIKKMTFSPIFSSRQYVITDHFLSGIINSDPNDVAPLGGKKLPKKDGTKEGDSFDMVFDSYEICSHFLSKHEIEALYTFTKDWLGTTSDFDLKDEDIFATMWASIKDGIKRKQTIRECLNDTGNILDWYLSIAKGEIDSTGSLIKDLKLVEDDYPFNADAPVVDAEIEVEEEVIENVDTIADAAIEEELKKEEVTNQLQDVVVIMGEIKSHAEQLEAKSENIYATTIGACLSNSIDNMKHCLSDTLDEVKLTEFKSKLTQI